MRRRDYLLVGLNKYIGTRTDHMTPSPVILCDDLIAEVLSLLRVKSLVRFSCVCKSWKTLIFDPVFTKLHLKRSSTLNPSFLFISEHEVEGDPYTPSSGDPDEYWFDYSVIPCPIRSLIHDPSFTVAIDPYHMLEDKGMLDIVGSCNGLICLACHSGSSFIGEYRGYWLCVWNPATRKIYEKFGYFWDLEILPPDETLRYFRNYSFKFGCDNSTNTYKVVATSYDPQQQRSNVRILSLANNIWRDIESFPVVPLHLDEAGLQSYACVGVYLGDTLNWLAVHNNFKYENIENITVDQFVIVSLHLGTETYDQYMVPRGFDEVPSIEPTISVCGGYLCFSYSYKKTHFVMWQMKKFGVEESWTQFLKIDYQLNFDSIFSNYWLENLQLVPMLLYEDSDRLILYNNEEDSAILYNWRVNRIEQTDYIINNSIDGKICWHLVRDYVESLVSFC